MAVSSKCSYPILENRIIITMNRIQVNGTLSPTPTSFNPNGGTLTPAPINDSGNSSLQDMTVSQLNNVASKLLSSDSNNLSPMEKEILNSLANFSGQPTALDMGSPQAEGPVSAGAVSSTSSSLGAATLTPVGPLNSLEQTLLQSISSSSSTQGTLTAAGPIFTSDNGTALTTSTAQAGSSTLITQAIPTAQTGTSGNQTYDLAGALQSAAALEKSQGNSYAASQFNNLLTDVENTMSQSGILTSISTVA
jgi:hypothetical protein